MKILITGGTGYVGRHLVPHLSALGCHVTILARLINASLFGIEYNLLKIDITNYEEVQAAITLLQPDVVIHLAAMSKPNDCELHKDRCFATNVTATRNIAAVCKMIDAKLIFLSTDFVFGNNGPYSEEDAYAPLNYYGQSKMWAEKAIVSTGVAYAIVRTVLVVGKNLEQGGSTFLQWVYKNLVADKTISVYTDQLRNITFVNDLSKGICQIVNTGFEGTLHLAGNETFTTYNLAKEIAKHCKLNTDLILPTDSISRPEIAKRPTYSVLNIDKARQLIHYQPTSLLQILEDVFTK